MERINKAIAVVTMLSGFLIADLGHMVFRAVTGADIPIASTADPASMIVWAGIAFARAFGAVLLLLGAVLWARTRPAAARPSFAPFVTAGFATFVLWAQAKAIWTTNVGFVFVVLMGALMIVSGTEVLQSRRIRA